VEVADRQLLATADEDRSVCPWDPVSGACALTTSAHHPSLTVSWVTDGLAVRLDAGTLVIDLRTRE
jgi:hypothetical protein